MKKNLRLWIVFVLGVVLASGIGAGRARAAENVSYAEAFGAATGFALYNTQVVLGVTADALSKDVYTADEARGIVSEQKGALDVLRKYVRQLIKASFVAAADKKSLKEIDACIDTLNDTADALNAYLDNPTTDAANDFQEKRKASYAALSDLLGLEK